MTAAGHEAGERAAERQRIAVWCGRHAAEAHPADVLWWVTRAFAWLVMP